MNMRMILPHIDAREVGMADTSSFPQIPATVWWGVRSILNKTPKAVISDDMLGVELSVQPTAARQYVSELKRVGLLNEESRATDLAHQWRMPDTYADAVQAILRASYGEGLLMVAPTPDERAKAIDWFQRQGLGEGAARNKTSTYFLIASVEPGEAPARTTGGNTSKPKPTRQPKTKAAASVSAQKKEDHEDRRAAAQSSGFSTFPVNLNLQIHISADASTDQIEAIFSSMRKHLGNAELS